MATISQLMEGKVPGSVKVRRSRWVDTVYFVPYFTATNHSDWVGVDEAGRHFAALSTTDDWTLYTEPKKKIAVYQWAIRDKDGDIYTPDYYYESEEKLLKDHLWALWYQRLDYTKIEVEEDV